MKEPRPILRLAREYAWRHRWSYLAGTVFLLLTNYLSVTIPIRIGSAIDAVRADTSAAGHVLAIALMGASVIVVRTLSRVLIFNPGRDVEYHVRKDLFARLLSQQPSFYATRSTGEIVNRASNDIGYVRALVGYGFMQVLNVTMAVSLTGWRMVSLSWQLTLGTLAPVLVGLVIVRLAIGQIFRLHREGQAQLGAISDQVLGSFQGVATIQGFVAERAFVQRFEERNVELLRIRMKMSLVGSLAFPALFLAGGVALYVVIAHGGRLAIQGQLSVGDVAAFATLLGVLLPPLRSLGWMLSVIQRGRASLERIFELMDAPVDRPQGDSPAELPAGSGPGFRLRDLDFAYPDEPEHLVLQGITADIPPGAVVGIFGRTGSGKTTLVRLLSRLYNPPPGTVFVTDRDGREVDITRLDLDAWRRRLAMAPQRPFLFSDSIAGNVALEDEPPAGRVAGAVDSAALAPDLASLPHGLDTVVGERGIMLSGGQRQRVALARALYRPADVVLLDDVLSAVDHSTEARLIETLSRIGDEPTTFIVSHRLSAIRHADVILVLSEGRLADAGTHEALSARPGVYRDTWLAQAADNGAARPGEVLP